MSASHVVKSADATARPAPPRKAHSSTHRVWPGAVPLHTTHRSFFACPRCCPFCRLPAPVVLCRVAASIFEQADGQQHDKQHHREQQQQELKQQQTDQAQDASVGEAVQQQGQASGGVQDPGGSLSAVVSKGGAGDVAACHRHLEQRRQWWWQQMQLREQGTQEAQQEQQEPGE